MDWQDVQARQIAMQQAAAAPATGQQAAAAPATGQSAAPSPTELESIIGEVRARLTLAANSLAMIYGRVIPPQPQAAGVAGKLTPVDATYAEKLRSLLALADIIASTAGELCSRI